MVLLEHFTVSICGSLSLILFAFPVKILCVRGIVFLQGQTLHYVLNTHKETDTVNE
jgi:hypothetical protein